MTKREFIESLNVIGEDTELHFTLQNKENYEEPFNLIIRAIWEVSGRSDVSAEPSTKGGYVYFSKVDSL